MKKFIPVLAVCMAAGLVSADIAIENENHNEKYYKADSTEVNSAFVQLIWADNLIGKAQAYNTDFLDAGEHLLLSFTTFAGDGGKWNSLLGDTFAGIKVYDDVDVEGADINNGYFFYRVFESGFTAENDFYLQQYEQGPTLGNYTVTAPAVPKLYAPNGTLGGTFSLAEGAHQVVPEPAVASLIVIFGGGLLVGRRIFFKG